LVLDVEDQEGQQKQTKKDIRMSNMKGWNLLEDCNNLNITKDTFVAMVMALIEACKSLKIVILSANTRRNLVFFHNPNSLGFLSNRTKLTNMQLIWFW
jgi:hypothetical protein